MLSVFAFCCAKHPIRQYYSSDNYFAKLSMLPMTTSANNDTAAKCVPCSSLDASQLLSVTEVEERLKNEKSLWKVVENNDDKPFLYRKYTAKNFQAALGSINEMGSIAERENHHPDIHLTNYRDVEIAIYTHKLGGITENDFSLAKMFDNEVKIDYSPKWLKNNLSANVSSIKK